MTYHPLGHVWIQLQEDVQYSPKVEWWLVNDLDHRVDLHVLDVLNEKLQFTCTNDNRFEEHVALDQFLDLVDLLLLCVADKNSLQYLSSHVSYIP